MTSLYIFVTSERPDQYLNSVVHCIIELGIRKVVLLHVKGANNVEKSQNLDKGISLTVFRRVQILMEHLAAGEYIHSTGTKAGEKQALSLAYTPERLHEITGLYKSCLETNVSWSHKDVSYLELRNELRRIWKDEPDSILDITAVNKSLLGDIIAASIIKGFHRIYTFDLKRRPDFDAPWTMLIHDLKARDGRREYDYVNIVETAIFRDCAQSILVRTPSLAASGLAAFGFLLLTLMVYFVSGANSRFVQATFIASAVSSLFSVYLSFFPPRR